MGDDTPVLEEAPRSPAGVAAPATGESEGGGDRNNRGNFTRNLNKEPDAQVARKMFLGGLALLPWLHLVNVWFFRRQFADPTVDPKVTLWVRRSFLSACIMTIVFIAWCVVFQLKWKDLGWQSIVMVVPSEDVNVGW